MWFTRRRQQPREPQPVFQSCGACGYPVSGLRIYGRHMLPGFSWKFCRGRAEDSCRFTVSETPHVHRTCPRCGWDFFDDLAHNQPGGPA